MPRPTLRPSTSGAHVIAKNDDGGAAVEPLYPETGDDDAPPVLRVRHRVHQYTVKAPARGNFAGTTDVIAEDDTGGRVVLRVPQDRHFAARLRAEASLARRHAHRSIVANINLVELGRWPVQVLEYVDGSRLDILLMHGDPLPIEAVCRIGVRMVMALEALHTRQPVVFHGALAADRVLVDTQGQVRLRDFGRLVPQTSPHYHSPGRRRSAVRGADERSAADDIYALGIILAEAALGHSLDLKGPADPLVWAGLIHDDVLAVISSMLSDTQPHLAALSKRLAAIEVDHGEGGVALAEAVAARRDLTLIDHVQPIAPSKARASLERQVAQVAPPLPLHDAMPTLATSIELVPVNTVGSQEAVAITRTLAVFAPMAPVATPVAEATIDNATEPMRQAAPAILAQAIVHHAHEPTRDTTRDITSDVSVKANVVAVVSENRPLRVREVTTEIAAEAMAFVSPWPKRMVVLLAICALAGTAGVFAADAIKKRQHQTPAPTAAYAPVPTAATLAPLPVTPAPVDLPGEVPAAPVAAEAPAEAKAAPVVAPIAPATPVKAPVVKAPVVKAAPVAKTAAVAASKPVTPAAAKAATPVAAGVPVRLVLDVKPAVRAQAEAKLAACNISGEVLGSITSVVGIHKVTADPKNPCLERVLSQALRGQREMNDEPFELAPRR